MRIVALFRLRMDMVVLSRTPERAETTLLDVPAPAHSFLVNFPGFWMRNVGIGRREGKRE